MERRNLPPFAVILGAGIVVVAALAFVLASLAGGARGSASEATLALATPVPAATSVPSPLPTPAVSAVSAAPTAPDSPLPTLASRTAPDFTLARSDGSTFTLSEQLAQGPVVLVFFQRCSS
jgi:cytochrome oxidase Cu insertion factor (SCO1/SenC/PrrC family)